MSWAEAKWVVDNVLQKVGQAPNNMRAFTAFSLSDSSIGLNFLEPEDSHADGLLICPVGGVMIRMSDEGYPTDPSEGTLVIDNKELGAYSTETFVVEGLELNKDYYFTAFPYSTKGVFNTSKDPANRATDAPGAKVYGISRDITSSSPVWTRTDLAVGMTATASVGTLAGSSDFDKAMPWAGMKRELVSTGDVMVKIPKFYFRRYREENIEYIQIADKPKEGFAIHPAFNHANKETDYIYVGAYKASAGVQSRSNRSPQTSLTRNDFRINAKNKGSGWGIIDISTLSAIQMLILVEFANNNVQSVIGKGYTDSNNSNMMVTGTCDNVPNLTGTPGNSDGRRDVIWRGIEGLWGNVWELVDGVNVLNGYYWVCNDPSKYNDDTNSGYEQLSYNAKNKTWSTSYVTELGVDSGKNSHIMMPKEATGGSSSTFYCDAVWGKTDSTGVYLISQPYNTGESSGLFTATFMVTATATTNTISSRALYIPS